MCSIRARQLLTNIAYVCALTRRTYGTLVSTHHCTRTLQKHATLVRKHPPHQLNVTRYPCHPPRFSRVVFCIALAENAIGPEAYLPHEILKSHRGLTVSVGNTDAEGRLILADALSWTQARYSDVRAVVDVATLTGACVVALGEYAAGVFANDAGKSLATDLTVLGEEVGEVLHPLPILPGHRKEISEHEHADVCSTGATRWGGACTAAAFLERFIDEGTPWAHMDIAGPGMASAERGVVPKGGTGFGAATLAEIVFGGRRA